MSSEAAIVRLIAAKENVSIDNPPQETHNHYNISGGIR